MSGTSRFMVFALGTVGSFAAAQAAQVTGTVLLPDGKPACGAPVWLIGRGRVVATVHADSRGRFRFSGQPAWANEVASRPAGAAVTGAWVGYRAGAPILLPTAKAVTVTGTVLDPTGLPLAGAAVVLERMTANDRGFAFQQTAGNFSAPDGMPGFATTSDRKGRFKFACVPEGALLEFRVRAPHLVELTTSYFGAMKIVAGRDPIVLPTQRCAQLTGTVTFNGKPTAGATVSALGGGGSIPSDKVSVSADGRGRYALEFPPEQARVVAELDGGRLQSRQVGFSVHAGDNVVVDVELKRAANVRGRVVVDDKDWNDPVVVIVERPGWVQRTGVWMPPVPIGRDGTFSTWLLPGEWQVHPNVAGLDVARVVVTDPPQTEPIQPTFTKSQPWGYTQRILVLEKDGKPAAGSKVREETGGVFSAVSGRNGEATLLHSDRGAVLIAASADLREYAKGTLQPNSDRVKLQLEPGVELGGVVRDAKGKPVADVEARVAVESRVSDRWGPARFEDWFTVRSDKGGNVSFRLPAGVRAQVAFCKPGWIGSRAPAFVVPARGSVTMSDVRIEECTATVSGVVLDASGVWPIPCAPVEIHGPGLGAGRLALTDGHGRFFFGAVPHGKVTVRVPETYFEIKPVQGAVVEAPASNVPVRATLRSSAHVVRIGSPVLSDTDVDWLGDKPVTVDGDDTVLVFATPFEPGCAKLLKALRGRFYSVNGQWNTVVVFDSTLSLAETREYAEDLEIADHAARVKETALWGRQSELFKRYRVEGVPMEVALDRGGAQILDFPVDPGAGRSEGEPKPHWTPMRYQVADPRVGSEIKGLEVGVPPSTPEDISDPKALAFRLAGARYVAVWGKRNGKPVVVFDHDGDGDLGDENVIELETERPGVLTAKVAAVSAFPDTDWVGHFVIVVDEPGELVERVVLRPYSQRIGHLALGSLDFRCVLYDSHFNGAFAPGDWLRCSAGDIDDVPCRLGDALSMDEGCFELRAEPDGTGLEAREIKEFDCVKVGAGHVWAWFSGDGRSWHADVSSGVVRVPKHISGVGPVWVDRKGVDGRLWWLTLQDVVDPRAHPADSLCFEPIHPELIATEKGGEWSFQVNATSANNLRVETANGVGGEGQVELDLLDSAGAVIATLKFDWSKGLKWNEAHGPKPVKARLRLDFGPFDVKPAEVMLPKPLVG